MLYTEGNTINAIRGHNHFNASCARHSVPRHELEPTVDGILALIEYLGQLVAGTNHGVEIYGPVVEFARNRVAEFEASACLSLPAAITEVWPLSRKYGL